MKAIVFVLIGVFTMPLLVRNIVLVHFYIQRDYIASEFCINKDEPNSCCNGSCVLQNQLEETSQSDKDVRIPFSDYKESVCDLVIQKVKNIAFNPVLLKPIDSYCFQVKDHISDCAERPPCI